MTLEEAKSAVSGLCREQAARWREAAREVYEAAELNWDTDEEEAAAQLPENVSSEGVRRVTIRSAGDRELPCYEFSCINSEGENLKIYVDAQSGKQCRIDI